MTLTDFLDSLTIAHDATTNTTVVNSVICAIAGALTLFLLGLVVYCVHMLYEEGFNAIVLFGIISALGLSAFFIYAIVHNFSLPALSIRWIVSTEDTDVSLLYQYFEVKTAPVTDTVEITPKEEIYQEALAWYQMHFKAI